MDVQRHLFLRRCFAYICCLLLCFITATTVYAQKVSVKGTVVDTNGDAIIGASVKVLKSPPSVQLPTWMEISLCLFPKMQQSWKLVL